MKTRAGILLIVCIGLLAQTGCSRFSSSKRLNLAPFAEDMIAVAGDIQYGLGQTYAVYLRGYSDTPEAAQMSAMAIKIRAIIRGAISYALEVVSLADSRLTGSQRTRALGDKIEELMRPLVAPPV